MHCTLKKFTVLLCCLAAINQLQALDVGIELTLNDVGLSVNGINFKHLSTKRTAVELACSLFTCWLASKMIKPEDSAKKIWAANAGAVVGSIAADFIFKDVDTKRIAFKTGAALGRIGGAELLKKQKYIKDPAGLGGKIGSIAVASVYQDLPRMQLYAASAIGEQLGMYLFDTAPQASDLKTVSRVSAAGKVIGSSCGIALAAPDSHVRNYFMKKALIDGIAMQAQRKIPVVSRPDCDPLLIHAAELCVGLTAATETLKQVA